jgi:hypothetical protein
MGAYKMGQISEGDTLYFWASTIWGSIIAGSAIVALLIARRKKKK